MEAGGAEILWGRNRLNYVTNWGNYSQPLRSFGCKREGGGDEECDVVNGYDIA